jgi:hypothetical protein
MRTPGCNTSIAEFVLVVLNGLKAHWGLTDPGFVFDVEYRSCYAGQTKCPSRQSLNEDVVFVSANQLIAV